MTDVVCLGILIADVIARPVDRLHDHRRDHAATHGLFTAALESQRDGSVVEV